MKYRVEVWLDNQWVEMCDFETRAEAENMVKVCEDDDRHYTRTLGWDFIREYRIVEVTK